MSYLVSPSLDGEGLPVGADRFTEAFRMAFPGSGVAAESSPGGEVVCVTLADGGHLRLSPDRTELWADVGSEAVLAEGAALFRSLVPAAVPLRLAPQSLDSALPVESSDPAVVLAGLEFLAAWWALERAVADAGAPIRAALRHGRVIPATLWKDGRVPAELVAMHSCRDGLDPQRWPGEGPLALFPGSGAFGAFADDAAEDGLWPWFGTGSRWWLRGRVGQVSEVLADSGGDVVLVQAPPATVLRSVVTAFGAGRFGWQDGQFTAFGDDPVAVVLDGLTAG